MNRARPYDDGLEKVLCKKDPDEGSQLRLKTKLNKRTQKNGSGQDSKQGLRRGAQNDGSGRQLRKGLRRKAQEKTHEKGSGQSCRYKCEMRVI